MVQIVTAVGWVDEFKCEGVESLPDFKAFIDELNDSGPASNGFTIPVIGDGPEFFDPVT